MITATFHLHTTGCTAAWIKYLEVHRAPDKNRNIEFYFFFVREKSTPVKEETMQNVCCILPLLPVTLIKMFNHFVTGMQMLQGILYQGSS